MPRAKNVRQHAPPGRPSTKPSRTITETQLCSEVKTLLQRAGLSTRSAMKFWSRKEESKASARDYAYVYTGKDPPSFHFSRRTLHLDRAHRKAIIAHEVGHVLAEREWGDGSEDAADQAAAEFLGVNVCYDPDWPGKGLQVQCRGAKGMKKGKSKSARAKGKSARAKGKSARAKAKNPRPTFQVHVYEEEVEWLDPEDSDGYETHTDEKVDDESATLEDVIGYAKEYGIQPRGRNDVTSWWESYEDREYDFSRNVSRTYTLHVERGGKHLDESTFNRINRLIKEASGSREKVRNVGKRGSKKSKLARAKAKGKKTPRMTNTTNPKIVLLDTAEDIQWLRDVHIHDLPQNVKSAMIIGNEDWPEKITTFTVSTPTLTALFDPSSSKGTIYRPDEEGNFSLSATERESEENPAPELWVRIKDAKGRKILESFETFVPPRYNWFNEEIAEEMAMELARHHPNNVIEIADKDIAYRFKSSRTVAGTGVRKLGWKTMKKASKQRNPQAVHTDALARKLARGET